MYGDRVIVEYHDMAMPQEYEQHKALLEHVPATHMYYPLVFVNDELRVTGSAEYYQIVYAVRDLLAE